MSLPPQFQIGDKVRFINKSWFRDVLFVVVGVQANTVKLCGQWVVSGKILTLEDWTPTDELEYFYQFNGNHADTVEMLVTHEIKKLNLATLLIFRLLGGRFIKWFFTRKLNRKIRIYNEYKSLLNPNPCSPANP